MKLKLKRSTKQLLALLVLLPTAVLTLGTIYMLGMEHLEGSPRTLLQGIQWASETITNTGYGADNRWNHPVMAMFVVVTPFIGQFLEPLAKVKNSNFGAATVALWGRFLLRAALILSRY